MTTLVVDANGEATLRKAFLEQVGARAGDMLEVEVRLVQPDRALPAIKTKTWDDIIGSLKPPPGTPPLSIEEMNVIIAKGCAGELDDHD